jgi:hypothetical protein
VYRNPNIGGGNGPTPVYNPGGNTPVYNPSGPPPVYNPGSPTAAPNGTIDPAFNAVLGQYALTEQPCNPYSVFIYINGVQKCYASGNGSLKAGAYAWQNFQLQPVGGVIGQPNQQPVSPTTSPVVYQPATPPVSNSPYPTYPQTGNIPATVPVSNAIVTLPYYAKLMSNPITPITTADIAALANVFSQLEGKPQPTSCQANPASYVTYKYGGVFALCAAPDNFHTPGSVYKVSQQFN